MNIFKIGANLGPNFPDIYDIRSRFNDNLSGYFLHVTELNSDLQKLYEANKSCRTTNVGTDDFSRCEARVNVDKEAGNQLGYAGGDNYNNALDFGLFDKSISAHNIVSKNRWKNEDPDQITAFTVCGIDYFSPEMKKQLETYLGYYDTKPLTEPACGDFNYDIRNSAQGRWFSENAVVPGPESESIALVYSNFDKNLGVISNGGLIKNLESDIYLFEPEVSEEQGFINQKFSEVKNDNSIHCYEAHLGQFNQADTDITKVILLSLKKNNSLEIEYKANSIQCNDSLGFSDNSTIFFR
ncbi:MAG: hypothetical protein HRT47_04890 [Candidatus Caenarcaniphilales bacterium]|nr:hypothetical protein [Candidatus Caenarcaniphilales bacterium]